MTSVNGLPVYLFLDCTGVLHPAGAHDSGRFVRASRLGALLADYAEVVVVVSRGESAVLDELRCLYGPSLGPRLNGVTPVVKTVLGGPPPFQRFQEIAYWLAKQTTAVKGSGSPLKEATARSDWIALDQSVDSFPTGCRQLVLVAEGRGLLDTHLAELEKRLIEQRRSIR